MNYCRYDACEAKNIAEGFLLFQNVTIQLHVKRYYTTICL